MVKHFEWPQAKRHTNAVHLLFENHWLDNNWNKKDDVEHLLNPSEGVLGALFCSRLGSVSQSGSQSVRQPVSQDTADLVLGIAL